MFKDFIGWSLESIGKTTVHKFEEFENAVFEADKAMYDVKFNKNKRCNV